MRECVFLLIPLIPHNKLHAFNFVFIGLVTLELIFGYVKIKKNISSHLLKKITRRIQFEFS